MKTAPTTRAFALDALRGFAVLWMTCFHFAFDLNYFGFVHQDFYNATLWTVQRTCILSLFLLCAGAGQALAVASGQSPRDFWRRWGQVAGCAVLVSLGSRAMFPTSWIYFGVLHGMAVMLVVCRFTASWGRWLWLAGALAVVLGQVAPQLHALWPQMSLFNAPALNWLGLVDQKPITEDYVPVLPWLGVIWWGMAAGQWVLARGWLHTGGQRSVGGGFAAGPPQGKMRPLGGQRPVRRWSVGATLAWIGRWSLSWYMVHQPLLIGLLILARSVGAGR